MDVVARAPRQPRLDLGVLVGGVVVHHQMDVEVRGHIPVDAAQEGQVVLVPVAPFALRVHLAGGDVERREQRRGAVRDVAVAHRAHDSLLVSSQGLYGVEPQSINFSGPGLNTISSIFSLFGSLPSFTPSRLS